MATPPPASILIVEDDGELLEVLQLVLEDAGYKVAGAADGPAALRLLAARPVDLVVLDVGLDGMNGLDVAREIRAAEKGARVLIALHTGLAESQVRDRFTDYDLFMTKADDADLLVRQLSTVLAAKPAPASPGEALPAEPAR